MTSNKVYHEGELAVQRRINEPQMPHPNGSFIRDHITSGAIPFIAQQPMVVVGSIDAQGHVWASVLFGMPGFLHAKDDRTLVLDQTCADSSPNDPLWNNLQANPQVGLLLIELGSRRRLRVNGRVRLAADNSPIIHVERAYPNCPKYIQRRHWNIAKAENLAPTTPSRRGEILDTAQQAWVRAADTFFVASAHPEQGVDTSHRGGRPGFVQVVDPSTLRIPDFSGNNMFNTLGNFISYPHAGLAFIDFDQGRVLQLSGRPRILWDQNDPRGETGGTCRYWEFSVDAWQQSELPLRIEWEFLDYSPFIPTPNPDIS